MLTIIPTFWLVAEVQDQHIQFRVSQTHLTALLAILEFNHAKSVSYAVEPQPRYDGATHTVVWPYGPYPTVTTTA